MDNAQQMEEEPAYLDPLNKTFPLWPGEKPHRLCVDFITKHRTPCSNPPTFTYNVYCGTCHAAVSIITALDSQTVSQLAALHQQDIREGKVGVK